MGNLDPAIWVALFVAVTAISATVSPLILANIQGRRELAKSKADAEIRAEEKAQDYKRQDEVALRLQAYTQAQADANKLISDKVDIVHTLVNSNLTEAKKRELEALRSLANVTREIIDLRKVQKLPDNPDSMKRLENMDSAISSLEGELIERAKQDDAVKEQLKNQAQTTKSTPTPPVTTPIAPAGPDIADIPGNPAGMEPIQVTVVNPEPVKVEVTKPKT